MIVLGGLEGSCSGNVIAYNYCEDAQSGSSIAGSAISDNHGAHNMMNLIEGNIAQMFESDGYWGSSRTGRCCGTGSPAGFQTSCITT